MPLMLCRSSCPMVMYQGSLFSHFSFPWRSKPWQHRSTRGERAAYSFINIYKFMAKKKRYRWQQSAIKLLSLQPRATGILRQIGRYQRECVTPGRMKSTPTCGAYVRGWAAFCQWSWHCQGLWQSGQWFWLFRIATKRFWTLFRPHAVQ